MRRFRMSVHVVLALLLSACTTLLSAQEERPAPPEGVHLLTEFTARFTAEDMVVYSGYTYSGGTEGCSNLNVRILWPDALSSAVQRESWTIGPGPFLPGNTGIISGSVVFNMETLNPDALPDLVGNARIWLRCDNYEHRTVPHMVE